MHPRRAVRGLDLARRHAADRATSSVGQQRHRDALVAAEQHAARDRARAEAVAHLVERRVERALAARRRTAARAARRRRRRGCATATPTSVRPARSISGVAAASSAARRGEDRPRVRGRARQRVRARRPREVVEAQPQHDRAPDPAGGAHPPRDPVDERRPATASISAGDRRRAAERALRADRAAAGGRPAPAAGRGCGRARAGGGPTPARASTTSAPSASARDLADGRDARARAACRPSPARRPTAARPAAGAGTSSSPSGGTTSRPSGLATPLATLARNLVRATPTVIGRPTSLAHRRAAAAPRSRSGVPGDPPQPAARRGTPRRSRGPRRAASCRRTPRTPPCSPRCRPTSAAATTIACGHSRRACRAAHRGADAERLRLVAGGEHDPAADDHRPAAQARVVALLDRRVERVEVGVQDRRLAATRTYVRIAVGVAATRSCENRAPWECTSRPSSASRRS